jgi:PqqD family protein of HPr-rel-A system
VSSSRPDVAGSRPQHPRGVAALEVNEAPDGLIIYDPRSNEVHHLNPSAAAVFVLCTGDRDEAAIAAELQVIFELPAPPVTDVAQAVQALVAQRLIE